MLLLKYSQNRLQVCELRVVLEAQTSWRISSAKEENYESPRAEYWKPTNSTVQHLLTWSSSPMKVFCIGTDIYHCTALCLPLLMLYGRWEKLHVIHELKWKYNKTLSLQNYVSGIKHRAKSFIIFMNNVYYPLTTHFLKLFSEPFLSQTSGVERLYVCYKGW